MFCMKCGAKLEDGAKFCPQCGAAAEQQAPPPAAAPVTPVTPVTPAPGPSQPRRSSTQRQQPMDNGAWQQPGAAYGQQPYDPGVRTQPPPAPAKKKKHTGLVVVLLIIVVLGVLAALNYKKISSYALRNFAPAERYYAHVEKQSISEFSANAAEAYDNWVLSNTDADNKTSDGGVELRLGSAGRDILMSGVGSTLKQLNPDEDLTWLQSLGIDMNRVTQDNKTSMQLQLMLNSTAVITLNMVADTGSDKVFLAVPELSDKYMELPLSQLSSMGGSGAMQIVGLVGQAVSMDNKQMADSLKSLPSKAKLEKLVEKYLNLILDCVDDVEKEKTTLEAAGISVDVTAMVIKGDGKDLAKAIESVCTEMKKDQDIKDIIINLSEAQGEDGAEAYERFQKQLDERLDNLDEVRQRSSSFEMTVYVDGSGEVVGREFTTDNFTWKLNKPEKGDKFGLDLVMGSGSSALHISGKGTKSGDKLSGEMDMEVGGTFLGILALDKLDEAKLKQGMFNGAIEIRPSDALVGAASSSPVLSSLMRNLVIRLEMDTAKNKGSATLTILSDGSELLSLGGKLNAKSGGRVNAASGVDMSEWSSDISPNSMTTIIDNLERAGVPDDYTSTIRALIGS